MENNRNLDKSLIWCIYWNNHPFKYILLILFFKWLLQPLDHGGLCAVSLWPPLIVCQIVFAMATAAMPGRWGRCACWWEGQRPHLLWATSTPPPLPLPLQAEPQRSPMAQGASPSSQQAAPSTPAARMSTPLTSTASTLKETPTLMHLTVEDLLFSFDQKGRERKEQFERSYLLFKILVLVFLYIIRALSLVNHLFVIYASYCLIYKWMKVFFLALCPCSSGKSFMILTPLNTVCLCCISLSMPQDGLRLTECSCAMIPDSDTDVYREI